MDQLNNLVCDHRFHVNRGCFVPFDELLVDAPERDTDVGIIVNHHVIPMHDNVLLFQRKPCRRNRRSRKNGRNGSPRLFFSLHDFRYQRG